MTYKKCHIRLKGTVTTIKIKLYRRNYIPQNLSPLSSTSDVMGEFRPKYGYTLKKLICIFHGLDSMKLLRLLNFNSTYTYMFSIFGAY